MPKKKTKKSDLESSVLEHLSVLGPFVKSFAQGNMAKNRMYSNAIRAAFAKCYEFNNLAWKDENSDTSFYWLPSLRGICEDLIVLNFIQGAATKDRDLLITAMMQIDFQKHLLIQKKYFAEARPTQRVISPPTNKPEELTKLELEMQRIWQENGWQHIGLGKVPPVQQMAAKRGGDILEVLYEYLYRITSRSVHFDVMGLFRTGWGELPNAKFSTANFHKYYAMFSRVYGLYLFCCYFELFARFLRAPKKVKNTVNELKETIVSIPRWPEVVTFEEMNIEPPKLSIFEVLGSRWMYPRDQGHIKLLRK